MGEAKAVKLLGSRTSPYCNRVEVALKYKGIPYEYVEEDLFNKSQLLLQCNPVHKKVPVIILEDGRPIAESLVILEYLDDKWSDLPAILPSDPYMRAKVRFWANFIDQKLLRVCGMIIRAEGEEREKAMNDLGDNLKILEGELSKDFPTSSPFLNGDSPGLLDFILGLIPGFDQAIEDAFGAKLFDPQRNPRLASWIGAVQDHPLVKETNPPHDKMVVHLRRVKEVVLKFKNFRGK